MDVAQIARLQTPEGVRLLAVTAGELARHDELAAAARLRRAGHAADDVAAAMTQVRLRERAVEKLGDDAARLLLTPDGLEQATHAAVAARRAARLWSAGCRSIVDLCCGIGSDLVALARAGLHV